MTKIISDLGLREENKIGYPFRIRFSTIRNNLFQQDPSLPQN